MCGRNQADWVSTGSSPKPEPRKARKSSEKSCGVVTREVASAATSVRAVVSAVVLVTVPWAVLPELVTGLELGSVRLAVASLDLDPHPAVQAVGHG